MLGDALADIAVVVPTEAADLDSVYQQHVADTVFDEPARQQTLPAEAFRDGIIQAIQFARGLRFAREVHDARGLSLHAERELVGADTRFEFTFAGPRGQVFLIHPLDEIELLPLANFTQIVR